jgi:hypothetical protein
VNPEESRKAFLDQNRKLRTLIDTATSIRGTGFGPTIAKPSVVLSFAEDLMLCPTEESALIRMQRDPEAARGFQIIAGDVASEVGKRRVPISVPTGDRLFHKPTMHTGGQ